MHQGPGNRVEIRHAVVYNARAAHAFSAGINCRHCTLPCKARETLSEDILFNLRALWCFNNQSHGKNPD